jgi:hypothetical protein
MISPASVVGMITTDPGWRTISAFSSPPLGSVIVSTCTLKMRPSNTVLISCGTIGWSIRGLVFLPSG